MSVLKSKRKLSSMEYIHNAQSIVRIIDERLNKYLNKVLKDKKYRHLAKSIYYPIWNAPLYHAKQVYRLCQLANKEEVAITRLNLLKGASENLNLIESSIQDIYANNEFRKVIKDKFLLIITDKIDLEYKLLNGCVRRVQEY